MKNARIEGDDVVYDCDGLGCPRPGQPHTVSLHMLLASLEATYHEFLYHSDPRAEALDLALQLIYQSAYAVQDACPSHKAAPWADQYRRLVKMIDAHYTSHADSPKEMLN